ncbi:hypothetical protein BJN45_08650 [Azonexus hydrophilus]|uniref:Uncharacterized protein n=2 Tax=Azonexus hydrophilus TaxID=418702 RepID=A0A1R1I9D4_9RHOO|nr:hypothetical protein BJN45_08650 [Azonexus hydrophilus]
MDIERKMSNQPSAAELVDTVFAGRAQVEGVGGTLRDVTKEEVKSLTDDDRVTFAQGFLKLVRGDEEKVEDSDSPVEALAAYAVAEWQAAQESFKEIANMVKAGFSEKTIGFFKESQSLAERVAAANKLPHFAEIAKFNPVFGTLDSATATALKALGSPAIKAAIRMQQTPRWNAVKDLAESPSIRGLRQFGDRRQNLVETVLGHSAGTAGGCAVEQIEMHRKSVTPIIDTLPPIKSAERILSEQIHSLKNDLGERMDRVGNAAVDIALQQDKTNSMIMSALVDMRNKWKEDEKSTRKALWFAGISLLVSATLTGAGVIQDYLNNRAGDKYQEQVIQLIAQQSELEKRQQQLLDQLAKSNEALAAQLTARASHNLKK